MWNVKYKSDTSNKRVNWNHTKTIQKISAQRTGKARNQGTTENNHIVHSTQTAGSVNVKVHNIFNMGNNIYMYVVQQDTQCGLNPLNPKTYFMFHQP